MCAGQVSENAALCMCMFPGSNFLRAVCCCHHKISAECTLFVRILFFRDNVRHFLQKCYSDYTAGAVHVFVAFWLVLPRLRKEK